MLKQERQSLIIKEVNIHNKVFLSDLSQKFSVSEDTIRRDLQELANDDKIVKVRGGALSKSYHVYSYEESKIYSYQEKTTIAQKAISLMRDGMIILIGGGSTNLEIARTLPLELDVTFFTIGLSTAMQLAEHPRSETIFIGGQLSKTAKISAGGDTISQLMNIRPDLCFLGTNGIDPLNGITDSDWEVVAVKKAMIQSSSKVAICTISEKFNKVQKIKVATLGEIDVLITEKHPDDEGLAPYRNAGVEIL